MISRARDLFFIQTQRFLPHHVDGRMRSRARKYSAGLGDIGQAYLFGRRLVMCSQIIALHYRRDITSDSEFLKNPNTEQCCSHLAIRNGLTNVRSADSRRFSKGVLFYLSRSLSPPACKAREAIGCGHATHVQAIFEARKFLPSAVLHEHCAPSGREICGSTVAFGLAGLQIVLRMQAKPGNVTSLSCQTFEEDLICLCSGAMRLESHRSDEFE